MKKNISLTAFSLMTAMTLTACTGKFSFEGEMGALSANINNHGLPASVNNGFIYYQGTDGFYEYDPEDKTSARVSDANLGFNAVKAGFIVEDDRKVQYLNHKGEILSRQSFPECDKFSSIFAYDDRIYCGDYVLDTKSGKTARLFEEEDTTSGFYYALSDEYYFKVNIDEKCLEKISVKDKNAEVQTMELPQEIKWVSEFAVDLNSDIYISSFDENNDLTLYKITSDSDKAAAVDLAAPTVHYAVLNNNIAYLDHYIEKESNDLYYNNTLVAKDVFRFTLLDEKYLIYTAMNEDYSEKVFLYDIENGETEQLKTVTEE